MKKIIALASIPCLLALLSGCATIRSHTPIHQTSLADGSITKVGYKLPMPNWQCTQIDKTSETWGTDKFKGMANLRGPYGVLEEHAVAYANAHHMKPDYIYLKVPTEVEIGGISVNPAIQAYKIYYQCKNPVV